MKLHYNENIMPADCMILRYSAYIPCRLTVPHQFLSSLDPYNEGSLWMDTVYQIFYAKNTSAIAIRLVTASIASNLLKTCF